MNKIYNHSIVIIIILVLMSCAPCNLTIKENCKDIGENPKVDLVILLNQTPGRAMEVVAKDLNAIGLIVFGDTASLCVDDLRVIYLGVDGVAWPTTIFQQSHRDYLENLHGPITLKRDSSYQGKATEQGAYAISDIAQHFDWREGACRAIFFIGEEELNSSEPRLDFENEDQATEEAIIQAQENKVTVFTHFVHRHGYDFRDEIRGNYEGLASETGGQHLYTADFFNESVYFDFLPKIVCHACNACKIEILLKQK